MLILAVMPMMSIYQLPQGQYGYSGHVIDLPQDVHSFSRSLPRLPSELDVIIVRKEGTNQSHRDFQSEEVLSTELCSGLLRTTSTTVLSMCTDDKVLSQLPEHGTLSQLRVIAVDSPATDGLVTSTTSTSTSSSAPTTSSSPDDTLPTTCNSATVNEPIDTYNAHLSQSFVPTAMWSITEQEAVVKSVEECQSSCSASPSGLILDVAHYWGNAS